MKLPSNINETEAWAADDRLAPGVYHAQIAEAKEETSSGGNPMIVLTWRVASGDWKGSEIRDWVTVTEASAGKVVALLQHTGTPIPPDGNLPVADLIGRKCLIVVRPDTYVKDGETRETTKVKGYKPLDPKSDVPDDGAFQPVGARPSDDDVPF